MAHRKAVRNEKKDNYCNEKHSRKPKGRQRGERTPRDLRAANGTRAGNRPTNLRKTQHGGAHTEDPLAHDSPPPPHLLGRDAHAGTVKPPMTAVAVQHEHGPALIG